jgi:hypothetical protein
MGFRLPQTPYTTVRWANLEPTDLHAFIRLHRSRARLLHDSRALGAGQSPNLAYNTRLTPFLAFIQDWETTEAFPEWNDPSILESW